MSPRPVRFVRDVVLERALTALLKHGADMTLAQAGVEVGLTGARMGQMFGSKRGLLVAISGHWVTKQQQRLAEAAARPRAPLRRLLDGAAALTSDWASAAEFPRIAAMIPRFAEDPALAAMGQKYQVMVRAFIAGCLSEAVGAGAIKGARVADLALTIDVVIGGAWMASVLRPGLPPETLLRGRLEAILRPYRTSR